MTQLLSLYLRIRQDVLPQMQPVDQQDRLSLLCEVGVCTQGGRRRAVAACKHNVCATLASAVPLLMILVQCIGPAWNHCLHARATAALGAGGRHMWGGTLGEK